MNIAFCYPTIFDPKFGGVERVTDLLARELTKRGYHIFFLHNKKDSEIPKYDYPVSINFFPYRDYSDYRNVNWYHKFLKDNEIDIVINQTGQFGDSKLYCDTHGVAKSISVIHNDPYLNLNYLFYEIIKLKPNRGNIEYLKRIIRCILYPYILFKIKKRLKIHYKWLERNTDKIILLSQRFEKSFNKISGIEIENVNAIPNPLSFPLNNANKKENLILWVGRFDFQKRPDLMLKLWKKIDLKDWKLYFIGDGPLLDAIKKQALNIQNVIFTGFKDTLPYYQKAKILCMTSAHEGFPMVINEAMSQGCVPIAFESYSSIRDIINDNRQLVKPLNVNEFVQKLSLLVRDEELLERLREKGYEKIKKFKIDKIVDQWESLFYEVLNQ